MVFQKPNLFPTAYMTILLTGPRTHSIHSKKAKLDEIVEKTLKQAAIWDETRINLKESAGNVRWTAAEIVYCKGIGS